MRPRLQLRVFFFKPIYKIPFHLPILSLDGGRRSQVLIQSLAADAELAGQLRFLLAGTSWLQQLPRLLGRQCFLAATIGTALLGQRDAFALPLADQGPLKLTKQSISALQYMVY